LHVQHVLTKPCVRLWGQVMQDEVLSHNQMKMPAVHYWHARRCQQSWRLDATCLTARRSLNSWTRSHSSSESRRSSIFWRFARSFSSLPISYTNVSTNYDLLARSLFAWKASHTGRVASARDVMTYVEDQRTAMSSRSWWTIFTPPRFWMSMKSCLRFAEERAYQ
jgi:hypothetical protein